MQRQDLMRWTTIGIGLAVLWAAYLALFGPKGRVAAGGLAAPDLAHSSAVGAMDYAWPVRDLDDKPVDLARYRGRPILLNIWATWCPPCRAEMPSLAALAADPRIKAKDVAVLCVSDEGAANIRGFVADKNWGMTMLRAEGTPPVFATEGIPATFLIGPDGKVVASSLGAARWDDPSVVAFLEQLAASSK